MRKKTLATLVFATLVLSGCAGIPKSSEVYYGAEVTEDSSSQFIRVIARSPSAGDNPEEIVRGFLQASADSSDDYGIAKEYLMPDSATTWNPTAGIEIYNSNEIEVFASDEQVSVTANKLGSISDLGRYTPEAPNSKISSNFDLQKNQSGEWRISKLDDGILLSNGDIKRSFRGFPIYFFNASLTNLITDSVLVPVSNAGAATSLVRSLLDGPSPYISSVATSAFPVGTSLSYGSVPVTDGIAQVDFSEEILGADELTRRALSAQLVWTLSVLPNVSAVEITVSGQPFALNNVGPQQTVADWEDLSPLRDPSFITLNSIRGDKIFEIENQVESERLVTPTPVLSASSNLNGSKLALVTSDLKSMYVFDETLQTFEVAAQGELISQPSWDPDGRIYYSDFGQGLREISDGNIIRNVTIDTSLLGTSEQVKQIAVASDGARVALVLSSGVEDVIAVGVIFRDEAVTRIIGLHRIEQSISSVRDIAWSSPTSIAAIASDQTGGELLYEISLIDGDVIPYSAPVGAQNLAVDGAGKFYASVVDGLNQTVLQQAFGTWIEVTSGTGVFFSR